MPATEPARGREDQGLVWGIDCSVINQFRSISIDRCISVDPFETKENQPKKRNPYSSDPILHCATV